MTIVWLTIIGIIWFALGLWSYKENIAFLGAATWVGTLFALDWLIPYSIWGAILANPIAVMLSLIAYILIGFVYTVFVSWPKFLTKQADSIKDSIASHKKLFENQPFEGSSYHSRYTAAQNKDKIFNWVMLWVFDALWSAVEFPVMFVYNRLYKAFATALNKRGNAIIDEIIKKG